MDLFESSPAARRIFQEADEILDFPLSRLCFEGPQEELSRTINAQPAIFTTSIACLEAARERGFDVRPDYVAGHSLGEYTALVAAGALDFPEALLLVRERGRLMEEAGRMNPGGMAAVIGLDEMSLREICEKAGVEIANLNSPHQIVISGPKERIPLAMDLAKARGAKKVVRLEVSGAFHSSLMEPAARALAEYISKLRMRDPSIPIIGNTTASPLRTAEELKQELVRQLCSCIRWADLIQFMLQDKVSTFIEIGPRRVLSGLIMEISRRAKVLQMEDTSSILKVRDLLLKGPEEYRFQSGVKAHENRFL